MALKNIFQDVRNVRNVRFWYAIIILEKVKAGHFLTVRRSRPVLGAAFPFAVIHRETIIHAGRLICHFR